MCFAFDAHPPDLPSDLALPTLAGGAAAEALQLTSADGTRLSAALAEAPDATGGPGVVVLPDVRGLYRFYVELAERFAQAGHHAIAIDYFGRTAGTGERSNDWDYMPHVMQTRVDQVQADAAAAIATLRERTGAGSMVTVGFCFGGTQSFMAATSPELDLDGAVGFYAGLVSWASSAEPTRTSHPSTSPRTSAAFRRPGSSTRSSATPARRTRSSTARTPSTPTPARTRGGACSASCRASGRRWRADSCGGSAVRRRQRRAQLLERLGADPQRHEVLLRARVQDDGAVGGAEPAEDMVLLGAAGAAVGRDDVQGLGQPACLREADHDRARPVGEEQRPVVEMHVRARPLGIQRHAHRRNLNEPQVGFRCVLRSCGYRDMQVNVNRQRKGVLI
jgi:hypothetical protein